MRKIEILFLSRVQYFLGRADASSSSWCSSISYPGCFRLLGAAYRLVETRVAAMFDRRKRREATTKHVMEVGREVLRNTHGTGCGIVDADAVPYFEHVLTCRKFQGV